MNRSFRNNNIKTGDRVLIHSTFVEFHDIMYPPERDCVGKEGNVVLVNKDYYKYSKSLDEFDYTVSVVVDGALNHIDSQYLEVLDSEGVWSASFIPQYAFTLLFSAMLYTLMNPDSVEYVDVVYNHLIIAFVVTAIARYVMR